MGYTGKGKCSVIPLERRNICDRMETKHRALVRRHLSLTWLQSSAWTAISPECQFLSSPVEAENKGSEGGAEERALIVCRKQQHLMTHRNTADRFHPVNTEPCLHFKDYNYHIHETSKHWMQSVEQMSTWQRSS